MVNETGLEMRAEGFGSGSYLSVSLVEKFTSSLGMKEIPSAFSESD